MSEANKKTVIDLSKKGSRLFRKGLLEDAEKTYLEACWRVWVMYTVKCAIFRSRRNIMTPF